jgi:poly(hydroxyalkanoate) granule-associated protein
MASKRKSRSQDAGGADSAAQGMRDSAQKIWLAGLGAFERAKSEGPKMFETLVEQGRNLGVKAREGADQALRTMRETSYSAGGRWDKLEQVFEDRVAKSLNRLGVITSREVDDLSRQVRELNENVRNMMRAGSSRSGSSKRSAGGTKRKAKATTRKATAGTKKAASKARRTAKRATRG